MYIHKMKEEIAGLEYATERLERIINTIRENDYTLPVGRPRDVFGIEKYDEPDGVGIYKGYLGPEIMTGEYMVAGEGSCKYSEIDVQKFEKELSEKRKELDKMRTRLAKAEKKAEKDPAIDEEEIYDSPFDTRVTQEATREELEARLSEIEKNHAYIQDNTKLVAQSDSLLGRIRRLLGNKKILGFGDVQRKAERLEKATKKEQQFVRDSGSECHSYEEAIHKFKYGKAKGGEIIELYEWYGPHDDYSIAAGKVTLKPFDYVCDEIGKRIYREMSISKDKYDALVEEYAKPETDEFTQNLQSQVNEEITFERDSKMEELLGKEVGSRLHDDWRAPRKKEDGTYEPRMKPTSDKKWIEAHGTNEVDIANTSFEDLPVDWQYENLEAGKEAVSIAGSRTEMTPEELREASIKVHEAWCDRKRNTIEMARREMLESGMAQEEVEAAINDKFGWDMSLMVPFDQLSIEEQQKDTDHILAAMKVNKELETGELTKAQMDKKFDDKSVDVIE